jgi:hypothetical protein
MYRLIQLFFDICILRKGPQDVPAMPWMLYLILPVYIAVNLSVLLLNSYPFPALFIQVFIDFSLLAGFCWSLVFFSGKPARFLQTLTALIGTESIISCFAIPVIAIMIFFPNTISGFVMLGLMVWNWLVIGHICRHALDRPLILGLGLSLLFILISSQIMALVFPVLFNQN